MNFEELETLWGSQQPQDTRHTNLAALKQRLQPELKRRSRFFAYEFFVLGFALVVTPVLAVVNFRSARPDNVTLYWLHWTLVIAVVLGFLVAAVRRLRRHRALTRADTGTLAAVAAQSLANTEAEIRDNRTARWALVLWIGLAVFSVSLNQPVAKVGWTPLAGRALGLLLVGSLINWLLARHCRTRLEPERARRQQVLEQLS